MKFFRNSILLFLVYACNNPSGQQGNDSQTGKHLKDSLLVAAEKFDSNIPDTKTNRQRFQEFFRFVPDSDVKNIFCYSVSPDTASTYLFSFQCDSSTINRVVKSLGLDKISVSDKVSVPDFNFEWWDKSKITAIPDRWIKVEEGLNEMLWYDTGESRAYFFDSDQ